MKKLILTLTITGAVALAGLAGGASAFPGTPSSCSDPFQQVCDFTIGRNPIHCVRLWIPGGPYACQNGRRNPLSP